MLIVNLIAKIDIELYYLNYATDFNPFLSTRNIETIVSILSCSMHFRVQCDIHKSKMCNRIHLDAYVISYHSPYDTDMYLNRLYKVRIREGKSCMITWNYE